MLVFYSDFTLGYSMKAFGAKFRTGLMVMAVLIVSTICSAAQDTPVKSQEVSEVDGQPVLVRHLPDYERVQSSAVFVTDKAALQQAVGPQSVLETIDFTSGTEAVTAVYPEGRLVIVEFTNPQSSVEADTKIQQHLSTNAQAQTVYRRIGNYTVFVFGVSDPVAATELLDQVKYEKTVQWLGEDPYLLQKLQRYMVYTTRDIFISTVIVIVGGIIGSILTGLAVGFIFFRVRNQRREERPAFSDAGGLTRLNLDGLTSEIAPK